VIHLFPGQDTSRRHTTLVRAHYAVQFPLEARVSPRGWALLQNRPPIQNQRQRSRCDPKPTAVPSCAPPRGRSR